MSGSEEKLWTNFAGRKIKCNKMTFNTQTNKQSNNDNKNNYDNNDNDNNNNNNNQ